MKKIVYILSLFIYVPNILFARKKSEKNITEYNHDVKYKSYIDTLNSWDFKKDSIDLSTMDSVTLKTFNDLNNYRKSLGIPELKYHIGFSLAAKIQSYYCGMLIGYRKYPSHGNDALIDRSFSYRVSIAKHLANINDYIFPIGEIINPNNTLEHVMGVNDVTPNGILNCFIKSKLHHLQLIDGRYTHVGIFINIKGNCVMVFGEDYNNNNNNLKYPKFTEHDNYIINCTKRYEKDFVTINGKEYYTNNGTATLALFNDKGGMYFLKPPYK